jgi:type VI secretion system secreted protein VgrG
LLRAFPSIGPLVRFRAFQEERMSDATPMLATLHVEGLETSSLEVIECTGRDALSTPYAFTILCSSADANLASRRMTCRPATLRLETADWKNAYSGLIFSFQKIRSVDKSTFYKVSLAPRFKLLELTHHNQVFLNKTLPQILEDVLKECNIVQYELRLMRIYEPMEYVCQYNETHFNFLSRWMEHSGLYYFFEETPQGEKFVVADTRIAHHPLSDQPFPYRLASGQDEKEQSRSVHDFVVEDTIVPRTMVLKDYNPLHPNLDLLVEVEVDPNGVGKTYHYGEHYQTPDQGRTLAKIRAEELACGKRVQRGQSGCLPLRAGGLFTLSEHPDEACNTAYLVTIVTHEARQTSPLTSGLGPQTTLDGESGYRNAFEAREASIQFRPARLAEKTRITGMLSAKIDAESSGQYAELDNLGRYKVRLPFDLAGEPDGHASSWLRLAEPYAGSNYGTHFPLHKGTEVLLAFLNADPDRPVIASAVHNGENKNPIKDTNAKLSGIKTAANNQLVFNDTEGQESVGIWSPFHDSGMAVGSVKKGGGGSLAQWTKGDSDTFVCGDSTQLVEGVSTQIVTGATNYVYMGSLTNIVGPLTNNLNFGAVFNCNYTSALTWDLGSSTDLSPTKEQLGQESVTLAAGFPAAAAAITAAKVALVAAIAGALTASAGAITLTETYSKDGIIPNKGVWEGILEGGAAAAGLIAAASAAFAAKVCVGKILAATKALRAATITLDNSGISMAVNNVATSLNAGFKLAVGPGAGTIAQTSAAVSSLGISAGGGQITLNNHDANTITLDARTGISIDSLDNSITINPVSISIKSFEDGGRATFDQINANISTPANDGLNVSDVSTQLYGPGGASFIRLSSTEAEITTPNFSINTPGTATINGSIIRVG